MGGPHTPRLKAALAIGMQRIRRGEGFIFLAEIEGTANVRIGFSLNPARRVSDPGCGRGRRSRLIAVMPGSLRERNAIHRAMLGLCVEKHSRGVYPRSALSHAAVPASFRVAGRSLAQDRAVCRRKYGRHRRGGECR